MRRSFSPTQSKDSRLRTQRWNPEQDMLIRERRLASISVLDPTITESSMILFLKDDTFTIDSLQARIDNAKDSTKGTGPPLIPSEKIIWSPESLHDRVVSETVRTHYEPQTLTATCCDCINLCGTDCPCQIDHIECYHEDPCSNSSIHDAIYPVTFLCQQRFLLEKKTLIKTLGVRTLEKIHKGDIIGLYAGTVKSYREGDPEPSDYTVNMTLDFVCDGDEELYIDAIPSGNTMSFINSPGDNKDLTNVDCPVYQTCNTKIPVIRAIKDIEPLEYLFYDYGALYFDDDFPAGDPVPYEDPLLQQNINDQEGQSTIFEIGDRIKVLIGFYTNKTGKILEILPCGWVLVKLENSNAMNSRRIPTISIEKL